MKRIKFTMRSWRRKWIRCMVGAVVVILEQQSRALSFLFIFFFFVLFPPSSTPAVIHELREELKALQSYLDAANEEIQVFLLWVEEV